MVEQIKSYKTADGKIFEKNKNAEAHEARLVFAKWYEKNKIYGKFEGCRIEFDDLEEWLDEHEEQLLAFYGRH